MTLRTPVTLRRSVLAALVAAVACNSDSTGPGGAAAAEGIVVLNGYGQPGVTLVPDTGTATSRIDFGVEFDGARFALRGDTLLSTSSSLGGDKLYVASLETRTLETFQMPGGSDPAGAAFLDGPARFAVALRGTGQVALARPTGVGTAELTLVDDVGRCPTDVAQFGAALFVADANASCAEQTFLSEGPARLIRIPADGAARDTIELPGAVGSVANVTVHGDFAWVAVDGIADYSNFPAVSFTAPGSLTKVNLRTGEVVASAQLPAGTYGAGARLGGDGRLYVTAYTTTSFAAQGVYAFSSSDLAAFRPGDGVAADGRLLLRKPNDALASCGAATADGAGRVYCLEVAADDGITTTLRVFQGSEQLREVPAGTGGVDVAVR